jgi:hypothetical protein
MERDNLMHGARTALNTNTDTRAWAENYLKEKTKGENPELSTKSSKNTGNTTSPRSCTQVRRKRCRRFATERSDRRQETGDKRQETRDGCLALRLE